MTTLLGQRKTHQSGVSRCLLYHIWDKAFRTSPIPVPLQNRHLTKRSSPDSDDALAGAAPDICYLPPGCPTPQWSGAEPGKISPCHITPFPVMVRRLFSEARRGASENLSFTSALPRDRHKASLCLSRVSTRPLTMVEGLGLTANILGIIVAADVVFRSTANLCDLLNRARTRPPPCHNSSMLLKVSFLPSLRCGFGPTNTNNSSLQAKMADVSPAKIISTLNRCGGQLNALVEEL